MLSWFRRHRLPRGWHRGTKLVQRRSNGRVYAVHHGGLAASMASLFGSGPKFHFVPCRLWRGRIVAAIDVVWHPEPSEFDVLDMKERRVLFVGHRVPLPIEEGGIGNLARWI